MTGAAHPPDPWARLDRTTRMECRICQQVYDPLDGDPVWPVPAGTPFAELPAHWCCPQCDGGKDQFLAMVDTEQPSLTDRIERTFEQIHRERMAGLPILNPALAVKLVGLRAWAGGWIGVLVTPWMMTLIALPGPDGSGHPGAAGSLRARAFPSGEVEFLAGTDPIIGAYETCSLFSPMGTFADQESAVATAESILAVLLEATQASPAEPVPDQPTQRTLSRRGLLRAALGGGA